MYLDIREQVRFIEKGLLTKDMRFIARVARMLSKTRKHLSANVLRRALSIYLPSIQSSEADCRSLLAFVPESSGVENVASPETPSKQSTPGRSRIGGKVASGIGSAASIASATAEIEVYLHLLVLVWLLDQPNKVDDALACSIELVRKLSAFNRRSLDPLAARAYYFFSLAHERREKMSNAAPIRAIRLTLHSAYRTSVLHGDLYRQATLMTLLLRNYLAHGQFAQAARFMQQTTFPLTAPNNEQARYHYYVGYISAIRLEYSAAQRHLTTALRKAPQHGAVGFRQATQKMLTVVTLLLGDIPDRVTFREAVYRKPLRAYFELSSAVRTGNLARFSEVVTRYEAQFIRDKTASLISRLRHNVIKAGMRRIALAYSRISLGDIARKLCLDSAVDAEYIVAKAIRDGVIEAVIVPGKNGGVSYLQSREVVDIYSTPEPTLALHQRTAFCLELHEQSVKAMRFELKQYHKFESAEERRIREEQELESAREMADDFDDFM